ncbi:MAG: hypothetical protein HGA37_13160, partial [Lentimicrobium sp.]|nr:hypothetical protein [Lentimicrobium sp.]
MESGIKNEPGLRESLIEAGKAFVAYRLPDSAEQFMMSGQVKIVDITDTEPLITGKPGFLMAGFNHHTPNLWLEADYFSRHPASRTFRNTIKPRSPIALPDIKVNEASEATYLQQVSTITDWIRSGKAGKVVLTRLIRTPFGNPLLSPSLFDLLCATNPGAFVYMAFFPGYGLWLGATPERLLNFSNQKVSTMALAGTRRAGSKGSWNVKDIKEHAYVADYIQEKLELTACSSIVRSASYTSNAGKAEHLRTDFTADCSILNVTELINELHPTPAVCGWPAEAALEIISKVEEHDRAYYTGYLGPVGNGAANLFVNLRCTRIIKDNALVYVGGGLTADSMPQAEW